ncbi:hypothetical protein GYMLUDRAFT_64521 [Collybiopsis luxurians FD-317 M1]|uniref:Uncharacterized protein n=1 Tax=Collybiopsis luxurians FD-317 M1 TaxID=944289 RepID=A0A0D0C2H5_9AGAR|nr:hypothetical protein GYMLUDRAFT_64521 [Collybiopsis luxurians FD-317 M1]
MSVLIYHYNDTGIPISEVPYMVSLATIREIWFELSKQGVSGQFFIHNVSESAMLERLRKAEEQPPNTPVFSPQEIGGLNNLRMDLFIPALRDLLAIPKVSSAPAPPLPPVPVPPLPPMPVPPLPSTPASPLPASPPPLKPASPLPPLLPHLAPSSSSVSMPPLNFVPVFGLPRCVQGPSTRSKEKMKMKAAPIPVLDPKAMAGPLSREPSGNSISSAIGEHNVSAIKKVCIIDTLKSVSNFLTIMSCPWPVSWETFDTLCKVPDLTAQISSLFYPVSGPLTLTQEIESAHYMKLLLYLELEQLKEKDMHSMYWEKIEQYLRANGQSMKMYDFTCISLLTYSSLVDRGESTLSWPHDIGVLLKFPEGKLFWYEPNSDASIFHGYEPYILVEVDSGNNNRFQLLLYGSVLTQWFFKNKNKNFFILPLLYAWEGVSADLIFMYELGRDICYIQTGCYLNYPFDRLQLALRIYNIIDKPSELDNFGRVTLQQFWKLPGISKSYVQLKKTSLLDFLPSGSGVAGGNSDDGPQGSVKPPQKAKGTLKKPSQLESVPSRSEVTGSLGGISKGNDACPHRGKSKNWNKKKKKQPKASDDTGGGGSSPSSRGGGGDRDRGAEGGGGNAAGTGGGRGNAAGTGHGRGANTHSVTRRNCNRGKGGGGDIDGVGLKQPVEGTTQQRKCAKVSKEPPSPQQVMDVLVWCGYSDIAQAGDMLMCAQKNHSRYFIKYGRQTFPEMLFYARKITHINIIEAVRIIKWDSFMCTVLPTYSVLENLLSDKTQYAS